jgi:signal recognition particle subunit SEC65
MKALVFTFVVLLSLILIWPKYFLSKLPPSEFRIKAWLFFQKAKYETLLDEASKTQYKEISYDPDYSLANYARLVLRGKQITNPNIENVVRIAKEHGIDSFRIKREDYGWL